MSTAYVGIFWCIMITRLENYDSYILKQTNPNLSIVGITGIEKILRISVRRHRQLNIIVLGIKDM